MLRILLITLVIAMVIAALKRVKFGGIKNINVSTKLSPAKMVKCASCELHLVQEDALESCGKYYCCPEHQRKAEIENRQ